MKQRKLFDILNFSIINKDLYFERTNNSFYKNNELLFSKIEGYSCFKDNIVVLFLDYAFLINESSFKRFDFRFNAIYITEDTIFVKKELSIDRKKYSYFLYDSINSKVSFYSKEFYFIGHPLLIFNQLYLVKEDKKTVCNLEIKTETTLWQYSVADLGAEKVSKILGVFGRTLVVVCEMPHPTIKDKPIELYLGIDIQSGQLLWQTQEIILPNGETDYMGGNQNRWQWHESATTLCALAGRNYFEFDTQTGQINIPTDIYPQLIGRHLDSIQSNSMEGDFLYFRAVDNTLGGFHSAIGAFNIIEKQISWHHTLKDMFESGGFIKNDQPKVSGNKIYVLDSKNTLHIFEREDETPDLNQ